MGTKTNQKGFTIVELLIVVVVIAILAAISIVAYTGITNRANRSAAMEAANSVRSVLTTYQGVNGTWPTNKYQFMSGGGDPIAKLPSAIVFECTAPTGTAPHNLRVTPYEAPAGTIVGYRVTYWDYAPATGNPTTADILVGQTTGGAYRTTSVHNDPAQTGAATCS